MSQQEVTFRKATKGTVPWSLGTRELAEWLEENWVNSESQPADENATRSQLLLQLSDTDGFELLTKCLIDDAPLP